MNLGHPFYVAIEKFTQQNMPLCPQLKNENTESIKKVIL